MFSHTLNKLKLLNYKLLKTYPNLSNIPRMGRLFGGKDKDYL